MKLQGLSAPMRAMAREQGHDGVLLEAELPWLTLGSKVETEIEAGRVVTGTVRWVGLDVTPRGSARLRILVGEATAPILVEKTAPVERPVWRPSSSRRPLSRWLVAAAFLLTLVGGFLGWTHPEPQFLPSTELPSPAPQHAPLTVAIPHVVVQVAAPPAHHHAKSRRLTRL
jgi:hypothetical protein